MRRAGTRISLALLASGRDGALGDQLGLRLAPADADRQLRWADAAASAVGEEALDTAVLQRVEGDRAEPSADAEDVPGQRQRAVQGLELSVDGDADRLEGSLGRVPAPEALRRRDRGLDRGHQLGG